MTNNKRRYESMIFNNETDYSDSYGFHGFDFDSPTEYKPKTSQRIRQPHLKNLHTMSDWKGPSIPFHTFCKPDPIIRGDPHKIQERFDAPVDVELGKVRKTRPRLIMTPASSLDAVEDESTREVLIKDVYTSTYMHANREAVPENLRVTAPFPGLPAPANPVSLPKSKPSHVSPEWRMETVTWDNKQLRCYCDTTAHFWLKRDISSCKACKERAIVTRDRNMKLAKLS